MARLAREDFVVIVLFAAVGLVVPTVVVARHFFGVDPLSWLQIEWSWGRTSLGVALTALATAICLWNFYASLVVPWDYRRRHGSMEGFAHMSGLPMVGGVCVLLSGALMPCSVKPHEH